MSIAIMDLVFDLLTSFSFPFISSDPTSHATFLSVLFILLPFQFFVVAEEGPRTETFYKKACYILWQYAQYKPISISYYMFVDERVQSHHYITTAKFESFVIEQLRPCLVGLYPVPPHYRYINYTYPLSLPVSSLKYHTQPLVSCAILVT